LNLYQFLIFLFLSFSGHLLQLSRVTLILLEIGFANLCYFTCKTVLSFSLSFFTNSNKFKSNADYQNVNFNAYGSGLTISGFIS